MYSFHLYFIFSDSTRPLPFLTFIMPIFGWCGTQALSTGALEIAAGRLSSCGLQALGNGLSSCGTQASLLQGMGNLPRAGTEPVFPALAGGFFFFYFVLTLYFTF